VRDRGLSLEYGRTGQRAIGEADRLAHPGSRKSSPERILRTNPVLTNAISAIERKDYLYVADMFEYEIALLLLDMPRDAV
jgi:hypothetical protein